MKKIAKIVASLAFLLIAFTNSPAMASNAQDTTAKEDMKDAGRSTKRAAKKTGSATKKTAKKGTHKAAKKTREGAEKVEDKTQPQR